MHGARRAAALTQHLLAFSRQQPLDPKPTEVNRLISGMSEMLSRTLGERVEVRNGARRRRLERRSRPQSARDGVAQSRTERARCDARRRQAHHRNANTHLDEPTSRRPPRCSPGQYVAICISDTGSGMTRETWITCSSRSSRQSPSGRDGPRPISGVRLREAVGRPREDLQRGRPRNDRQALSSAFSWQRHRDRRRSTRENNSRWKPQRDSAAR